MALVARHHVYPGAGDTGDRKIVSKAIASDKTDASTAMDYIVGCIFEICCSEKQIGGNCRIPEYLVGGIHPMIRYEPFTKWVT